MDDHHNLHTVLILTVGFSLAALCGYLVQKLRLPLILGYLIAGYLIGPYSPGFVADIKVAEQLAEIGVILMLFGVGMHFKLQDLMNVKYIAIPGAVGQTLIAVLVSTLAISYMGWSISTGLIIGLAIGVASTVILIRVLSDYHLLDTLEGHIAVGWLVVEDLITVMVLILLPSLAQGFQGEGVSFSDIVASVFISSVKFGLLVLVMFTWGRKWVAAILINMARIRSHELFTVTVLALAFLIAVGSALVFGTSLALGAFIAGMIVGQTSVSHQAAANSLPMKDTFAVIFFLSIGMLFNPLVIVEHPILFVIVLVIILIVKPLTASLIVLLARYPMRIALIVGLALAQIGEFSFILIEEATRLHLLPDEGFDVIVACALLTITLNPILFRWMDHLQNYVEKKTQAFSKKNHKSSYSNSQLAIIVGFGPIGQSAYRLLDKMGFHCIVIDRNVDTITNLNEQKKEGIFGDASHADILKAAKIKEASLIVITTPDIAITLPIIKTIRELHPSISILARARYKVEAPLLQELQVDFISCEDETSRAFSRALFDWHSTFQRSHH
jgi:CPA2 family monovalent cation:H+ antiporter-2